VTSSSSLAVGMVVHGYVKSASSRGLFVALSRNVDAYARLCNLADTFVAEPSSSFPAGKLVQARVLSVDGRGRVEVTLKMDQPVGVAAGGALAEARAAAVAALDVGQTVWGDVRKIERFGVFVQLDGPGAVSGLCHISELADEFVKDAAAVVQPGERVRARVLRVDQEKGKVYLGLKPSYFEGEGGVDPKGVNSKTTFDDDDEDGSDEHGSSESEVSERRGLVVVCGDVGMWARCVRGLSQADARAMRTVNTGTRVELRR
jgi:rRNA biogenesis protein RRP5